MAYTDIKFTTSKVIITYDLNNNEISAQDIADASNGIFYIDIHTGNGKYKLPNTTLISDKNISVENAIKEFKKAFLPSSETDAPISTLFKFEKL